MHRLWDGVDSAIQGHGVLEHIAGLFGARRGTAWLYAKACHGDTGFGAFVCSKVSLSDGRAKGYKWHASFVPISFMEFNYCRYQIKSIIKLITLST